MAKPVLGRDLAALLGRAHQPPSNTKAEAAPATEVTPGVKSLMQGARPQQVPTPAPVPAPAPSRAPVAAAKSIPLWYLFAGDAVLVAVALLTIWRSPHPLSTGRLIFACAAIGLAALLGVVAVAQSGAGAGVVPNGKSPEQFGSNQANSRHPNQER